MAVGYAAFQPPQRQKDAPLGLLLHRFKPYLNVTIPFRSPQTQQWEPQIRQSETQSFPLVLVQQTLATLLSALKPSDTSSLMGQAEGLSREAFQQAMSQLAGVVINHPVGSSDAYRFNMREAVLEAELVSDPAQIYFVEEAIAALLPEVYPLTTAATREQGILVISAGTSVTELVLAKIPANPRTLSRHHLALRRLAYAGNALDQDIICQLLLPSAIGWEALSLNQLNLPLPGEPDLQVRYRLQQRLESVPLGQTILRAVRQIKPSLCQQDVSFTLEGYPWQLRYQDLRNWVLAPYLQQLNREVNLLLTQLELAPNTIQTVVCTGGTASIALIPQWLQRKFPQATVVHGATGNGATGNDTAGDEATSNGTINLNRATSDDQQISMGLALLPHFPGVLDNDRHQFSQYFLLRETLKTLPVQAEPLSEARILSLLEAQGIPTSVCQAFVNELLEGQLPSGLLLSKASAVLLSPESVQNTDYQELAVAPLFSRQGNQVYRLNRQQRDRLWSHLQIILANTHQTLEAPLDIGLEAAKQK
ncbi:MAG: hypothetical protein NW224_12120 [Leptolyngbyaceae cyanobacterium bins.302]|nr:hypothetical protein [Leptolyngbyaceae cyanobacterium bins.302]